MAFLGHPDMACAKFSLPENCCFSKSTNKHAREIENKFKSNQVLLSLRPNFNTPRPHSISSSSKESTSSGNSSFSKLKLDLIPDVTDKGWILVAKFAFKYQFSSTWRLFDVTLPSLALSRVLSSGPKLKRCGYPTHDCFCNAVATRVLNSIVYVIVLEIYLWASW